MSFISNVYFIEKILFDGLYSSAQPASYYSLNGIQILDTEANLPSSLLEPHLLTRIYTMIFQSNFTICK
jgi:hypothetical protein